MKILLAVLALAAFPSTALAASSDKQADTVVANAQRAINSHIIKSTEADGPKWYAEVRCDLSGKRYRCNYLTAINYADGSSSWTCGGLDWASKVDGEWLISYPKGWTCTFLPDWTIS